MLEGPRLESSAPERMLLVTRIRVGSMMIVGLGMDLFNSAMCRVVEVEVEVEVVCLLCKDSVELSATVDTGVTVWSCTRQE
jgi:hypothetical protein